MTITDAAAPDGVWVTVGSGAGQATFSVCGGFTVKVSAGGKAAITCGSVTVDVVQGAAEVSVGDGSVVVSISEGALTKVSDNGDGTFAVKNLGDQPVTVSVDGNEQTVDPGGSTQVEPPPADVPPTAVDDSASVNKDSGATPIDVLANDTDPDGGPIEVVSVTNGAHGGVAIAGAGVGVTYQPDHHYCGTDSFTYTLNGGSAAVVSVTVRCGHHFGHRHRHGSHGHGSHGSDRHDRRR